MLMRLFLERALWWSARRLFDTRRIGGIDFIYVGAWNHRTADDLEVVLTRALKLISAAKGGFGELVTSHLRLVGSLKGTMPYVSDNMRAYFSRFRGPEATNGEYLACQLVWAATFIRLSRDSQARGVKPDLPTIRQAAHEAQLRFVRQFADSEQWVEYLEEIRPEGK
jgi:hypothetical protein